MFEFHNSDGCGHCGKCLYGPYWKNLFRQYVLEKLLLHIVLSSHQRYRNFILFEWHETRSENTIFNFYHILTNRDVNNDASTIPTFNLCWLLFSCYSSFVCFIFLSDKISIKIQEKGISEIYRNLDNYCDGTFKKVSVISDII